MVLWSRMKSPKLRPVLLLCVVFVAGVIVGATATRVAVKKFVDRVINRPDAIQQTIERDLTRKLKLRPEQRQRVHEIATRCTQEMKSLRAEFQPKLNGIIAKSEQEVRAILDEDQKVKFDRMVRQRSFKSPP